MSELTLERLTPEVFEPFGDVIAANAAAEAFEINEGTAMRFHDLARVAVVDDAGVVALSLFRCQPVALPTTVSMVECHPLGSQVFVPLHGARFIVVVAAAGPCPGGDELRAFVTDGAQGVHYAPGVWHQPLMCLEGPSDFLVIDRVGPGENLETCALAAPPRISGLPD